MVPILFSLAVFSILLSSHASVIFTSLLSSVNFVLSTSVFNSCPIPQPHSFPFDVRHNLLSSKESASSSYKAAYPFVQGLEFAAVQIIAVDTERNSGSLIAGYLIKAGHPIQNTDSTGDLNRGRRACRLLETWSPCSHPFAILPVSAVSDAQKLATGNFLHVRAAAFWFFLQKQKE